LALIYVLGGEGEGESLGLVCILEVEGKSSVDGLDDWVFFSSLIKKGQKVLVSILGFFGQRDK
jgi:aspartate aminotransferase-like enzyme